MTWWSALADDRSSQTAVDVFFLSKTTDAYMTHIDKARPIDANERWRGRGEGYEESGPDDKVRVGV